ncbi:aromatic ring-hydroxylating oxygenase subunit alpha [Bosea sp. PAMC 26642]|uniref:aromatic ring-hydroxylating oxygenase subunit alpha n=1 Tax=Bosea sp. (strain PAMC 26642) TaxID=1792307 RepID=UPI000A73D2BA|nr:Rieske (2Fe-2S) protein [Bosea sp. PAMC 26642]
MSLPHAFYNDPDFFRLDMRGIFESRWIFAGPACELTSSGSFFTIEIGETSVVVCRDREGVIRAFFNSCRHRGSIVVDQACGRRMSFVCPYHHWSYDLTGRLLRAANLDANADKSELGLRPVHVRDIAGLIYICLADVAPDIEPFAAALGPAAAPHDLTHGKVVHTITLHEQGNWKLVMENARECDHCEAGHPG